MRLPLLFALFSALVVTACLPALNWREVRPPSSGAAALFPCKPEFNQRPAAAGQGAMGLAQCEAAGARFSLSWADAADATEVGPALRAMPEALAGKLHIPLPRGEALRVPGMTPHVESAQHHLDARGQAARIAVFAHGPRVYQALRVGPEDDAAAWDTFLSSLRVGAAASMASGSAR
jgi:hypothetical protein